MFHLVPRTVSGRFGLVVNARNAMPTRGQIQASGAGWVRSIVYDFDSFELAMRNVPETVGVIALLNTETEGVWTAEGQWAGWTDTVARFAERFKDRVDAIEMGNELDAWGVPPEVGAQLVVDAAWMARRASMEVLLASVASDHWQAWLAGALAHCREQHVTPDGVALHPYGQRPTDWKNPTWGFGDLREAVNSAYEIAQLPVWITEDGIKVGEAGGEDGQASFVHQWFDTLRLFPASQLATACYFAWRDDVGTGAEQGAEAFGLLRSDNTPRPAWDAFAYETKVLEVVVPPQTTPLTAPPHVHNVGSGLLAMMAEDNTAPSACSTFLPLGVQPAEIEVGHGANGTDYKWELATGNHWRFLPD